ncbi:MAG: hypothetical protein ACJATA_001042 [Sphingobacteriales bacterium]|jgi:hypothetical protein
MSRIIIVMLLFVSAFAEAQNSGATLPIKGTRVFTDQLDQAYVITEAGEIIKINNKGEQIGSFSSNLGEPAYLDVSNPFKILVWYPQFYNVLFLDNQMTKVGELNLQNLASTGLKVLASAENNTYWYYSENAQNLRKINQKGAETAQGVRLSQYFQASFTPNQLVVRGKKIYLNDPTNGILVFDNFGAYITTYPYKNISKFSLVNNKIQWFDLSQSKYFQYDEKKRIKIEISLPNSNFERIDVSSTENILFVLTKNALILHSK